MKKLFSLLFLLMPLFIFAQWQTQTIGAPKTIVLSKGIAAADSATIFTRTCFIDTASANRGGLDTLAGTVIRTCDDSIRMRSNDKTKWITISGGGGSVNSDSVVNIISGGDTTIFNNVLDSTGQTAQRVLFGVPSNHIGSSYLFIYDSVNHKLAINYPNFTLGGNVTKLLVGGDIYSSALTNTGGLTVRNMTSGADTATYKLIGIASSGQTKKFTSFGGIIKPFTNLSWNSGTHSVDISSSGTSAEIPISNFSTLGLIKASGQNMSIDGDGNLDASHTFTSPDGFFTTTGPRTRFHNGINILIDVSASSVNDITITADTTTGTTKLATQGDVDRAIAGSFATTPTLDQILTAGNTTSQNIISTGSIDFGNTLRLMNSGNEVFKVGLSSCGAGFGSAIQMIEACSGFIGVIDEVPLSANRQYRFPDKSGTIAITSDIATAVAATTFQSLFNNEPGGSAMTKNDTVNMAGYKLRFQNPGRISIGVTLPDSITKAFVVNNTSQRNIHIGPYENWDGLSSRSDDSTYYNVIQAIDTISATNTNTNVQAGLNPRATLFVRRKQTVNANNIVMEETGALMVDKEVILTNVDSVLTAPSGSDFIWTQRNRMLFRNKGTAHRVVIQSSPVADWDVTPVTLSSMGINSTTGVGNSTHMRKYWSAYTGYFIDGATTAQSISDTVDAFIGFFSTGFMQSGVTVSKYYDFASKQSGIGRIDSLYFLFQYPQGPAPNGNSTANHSWSYIDGKLSVGGGVWGATDRFQVQGTAKITDTLKTPNIALKVIDTTNLKLEVVDASGNHFKMNYPVTPTITATNGGTGQTTYTLGDILYSDASNSLAKLAGNTTTTKKFLRQTGNGSISAAPAWDVLVAGDVPDLSGTYQPLDADLTTISGLTATTDNFLVGVSSAWASRTPAQVKTTLSLNNVDNTSDATKNSASVTLTNKTITAPIIASITNTGTLTLPTVTGTVSAYNETGTTSSSTPTPTGDSRINWYQLTALAAAPTFAAPSGTPSNHNEIYIRILDNATARVLAWNAIYRASPDLPLPTTTVLSKTMYLHFVYNSADSKWDFIGYLNNF